VFLKIFKVFPFALNCLEVELERRLKVEFYTVIVQSYSDEEEAPENNLASGMQMRV